MFSHPCSWVEQVLSVLTRGSCSIHMQQRLNLTQHVAELLKGQHMILNQVQRDAYYRGGNVGWCNPCSWVALWGPATDMPAI